MSRTMTIAFRLLASVCIVLIAAHAPLSGQRPSAALTEVAGEMEKLAFLISFAFAALAIAPASAQIKAQARSAPTPPWNNGILPIGQESYWNAVECGKQGGQDPPCVFWDTGLCKNDEFTLAMYTPYKMVAYEVWTAVRQKREPPTPSYQQAQRTRITVGITPVRGSKNPFATRAFNLDRGGRHVRRRSSRRAISSRPPRIAR